MKTKFTFIGFILLLGMGILSAQICPPTVSFSWGNDSNRNYDRNTRSENWNRNGNKYTYNSRRDRNWDSRKDRNRGANRRYRESFVIYDLDIYRVSRSFRASIDEGYRYGNLTRREVRKLEDRFRKVEREFKCALEDGYISRKDENRIFDKINDVNERLYKEWYDNDFR